MIETSVPAKRFALALLIAHVAAAYSLAATMLLLAGLANLFDADTFAAGLPSPGRVAEGVLCFPLVALAIAMPAAILLVPYSALGALIAWPLAARRQVGPLSSAGIGAGAGLLLLTARQWLLPDEGAQHWIAGAVLMGAAAAASGAAYGWVIWRIAIKPRRTSTR